MPYLLIRQRFTDYEQWRAAFDSVAEQRTALGLETVIAAPAPDDPDQAVVLFRFDDLAQVRRHFPSPELADAHERGGVLPGSTEAVFLAEVPASD